MARAYFSLSPSYNPAAAVASGYSAFNPTAYAGGRVSAPPPDFEQRVPSALTSLGSHPLQPHQHPSNHHHHRHSYNDYTGFSAIPSAGAALALAGPYPKHKSYLSSTMVSIPKSSSAYYVGAPAIQDTNHSYKHRHSFDANMLPPNGAVAGYLPPKFQENVSKRRF